jgi:hypothetical protein
MKRGDMSQRQPNRSLEEEAGGPLNLLPLRCADAQLAENQRVADPKTAPHQQLQSISERVLALGLNKRCEFRKNFGGAARI